MRKILLVLPRFDRQRWDSLTDQAWTIARKLTSQGEYQCIIAAARSERELALEVIEGVTVYRFLPEHPRWKLARYFCRCNIDAGNVILPGLEILIRKKHFDLVHLMCGGRLSDRLADILHELKVPWVISCRSGDFRCRDIAEVNMNSECQERFMRRFREYGRALTGASRILVGDHQLRRLLAGKLGDRQLVHFLPGVDVERLSKMCQVDFRSFYQLPGHRHIILNVGGMLPEKNQKLLLETLSVLRRRNWNCHLVVIAPQKSDSCRDEFQAYAAKLNLETFVTLIPGLPPGDERFCAAFQSSALLLLPDRFDVSASAVLEAWAAGVPVVASPIGSGGELIEDGVSGRLVNPLDFHKFVSCCEDLLNERNRSQVEKIRTCGLTRSRELRWEVRLKKLTMVYEDVLQINQRNHDKQLFRSSRKGV